VSLRRSSDTGQSEWVQIVLQHLGRALLAEQSVNRLAGVIAAFDGYLRRGHGVDQLRSVEPSHVRAFIRAHQSLNGVLLPVSIGTMHTRRSAVRIVFRISREIGLASGDPTMDIALPPRSPLSTRPLTEDEIALCRSFALSTLTETRQPAI
jgi:site-specific recombinase XerD